MSEKLNLIGRLLDKCASKFEPIVAEEPRRDKQTVREEFVREVLGSTETRTSISSETAVDSG